MRGMGGVLVLFLSRHYLDNFRQNTFIDAKIQQKTFVSIS